MPDLNGRTGRAPWRPMRAGTPPATTPARAPLVQVLFNVYNFPQPRLELPGLRTERLEPGPAGSPFDLTLYVVDRDGHLARLDDRLERVGELGDDLQRQRGLAVVGAEAGGRVGHRRRFELAAHRRRDRAGLRHDRHLAPHRHHHLPFRGGGVNQGGTFNFNRDTNNPLDTNHPFANALLGSVQSYSEATSHPDANAQFTNVEWFVQDNWRRSARWRAA